MRCATVLAIAAGALLPSMARANAVIDARYELDRAEARILLTAREPVGEPSLRIERGGIRVWLPAMSEDVRLDPPADGRSVRAIRVRPGAGDSAVVFVELGDGRRVPPEAVSVDVEGNRVTVRIARAALPASPVPQPEPDPVTARQSELAEPDVPSEETGAEPAGAGADREEPRVSPAAPDLPRSRRSEVAAPPDSSTSGLPVMILVTLVLGGVYLIIRALMRRRGGAARPDIEVVASRRLGTRHQIVVVRALGQDHLLSVHGGQTTRIASSPSPAEADRTVEPRRGNVLARLSDRLRPVDSRTESGAAGPGVAPNAFGAELLRLTDSFDRSARPGRAGRTASQSESVSGLLRLRREGR